MQIGRGWFLLRFALFVGFTVTCGAQTTTASPAKSSGWSLVWGDEFNGPNGSAVDRANWVFETGGDGWGKGPLRGTVAHCYLGRDLRPGRTTSRVLQLSNDN